MTTLDAGEPRTAAGKALLAELRRDVHWFIGGSSTKELAYITAIEVEAREPLDVERLARAFAHVELGTTAEPMTGDFDWAVQFADAYEALRKPVTA